ncbi:hypothetical protein HD806DRAFT_551244 [Xylariaceae sp. AK1471]|nr:hypothetical protein HD806DRAFT_551244 [Xylariaceae sp. AK1471]
MDYDNPLFPVPYTWDSGLASTFTAQKLENGGTQHTSRDEGCLSSSRYPYVYKYPSPQSFPENPTPQSHFMSYRGEREVCGDQETSRFILTEPSYLYDILTECDLFNNPFPTFEQTHLTIEPAQLQPETNIHMNFESIFDNLPRCQEDNTAVRPATSHLPQIETSTDTFGPDTQRRPQRRTYQQARLAVLSLAVRMSGGETMFFVISG